MTNSTIRLIIVDDHAIMREGLVNLLGHDPDLHIVGLASSGREAVALAQREVVDVILLDIVMDDMTGLEAARQILTAKPDVKIVMMTMYEEKAFIQEARQIGVSGYFLKGSNSTELMQVIRLVHEGGSYVSPKLDEILN